MEALPELEAAGARLVVVTPQSSARAGGWRGREALQRALVVADPELTLYRALGARRPAPLWIFRPRVALAGLKAFAKREGVGFTREDDARQLGADLVLDGDGRIALLHLARDPADRVPPAQLIAAVRGIAAAD